LTPTAAYLGIPRVGPARGFLVSADQMNSLSSGKNLAREDKLALCGLCVPIGYTLIQDLFAAGAADSDGCASPRLVVRNIRASRCEGLSTAR
jgi:hypothetical protein